MKSKRHASRKFLDKGTMLRKLIGEALREYNIKKAFNLYSEGKISLWKAARMAGLTYRGALEELKKRNIPFRYEKEDLAADIKWAGFSDNACKNNEMPDTYR